MAEVILIEAPSKQETVTVDCEKNEESPKEEVEKAKETMEEKTVRIFVDAMSPQGVPVYMQRDNRSGGGFFSRPSTHSFTADAFEEDPWARRVFISTVYSILMVQLLFSTVIILLFTYLKGFNEFAIRHYYLCYVWMTGWMSVYFSLVFNESVRKSSPTNMVIVTLLTIFMSLSLGFYAAIFKAEYVIMSIGMTAAVTLLISLLARTGLFDLTGCGMLMVVLGICFSVFGLVTLINVHFTGSRVMMLVYSGIAMTIICLYLMYDTQLILGGKRVELETDEYILGAIQLYIDICYIFQLLLLLFGLGMDD